MARLINVINKPLFFTYKEGKDTLCWYNEYTAVIEKDDGDIIAIPVTFDDLFCGNADKWLRDYGDDEQTCLSDVSWNTLDDILNGERNNEGCILEAVKNVLRNIARSKVSVTSEVLDRLKDIDKSIREICTNVENKEK